MPHDVMPLALSPSEIDDESLPPDNPSLDNPVNDNSALDSSQSPEIKGPSLLSMMRKAGRSLVGTIQRKGNKALLASMMLAGAALVVPQASAQGGCYYSNGNLICGGNPSTGGSQGPGNGTSWDGDPVNIATGNVYLHVTDYKTAGQNPLEFTRYYNSMAGLDGAETTFATTLGNNWRSTYDRYLQISPAASPTTVTAELDNGRQIAFTLSGSTWVPPSDVDYKLTHSGSTWTLTDHNDTVEVYGDTGTGEGVLSTITSRNGYQQTLNYGASFASIMSNWGTYGPYPVQSVTDSYSRTLSFSYSGGMLQTVTTPDTPTFTYGYTSAGSGTVLTSVSYNTSPTTSQTYAYAALSSPYALTSVVDENGNTSASWAYDSVVRAVTSAQNGSVNSTIFTYNSDNTVTVNNAYGVYDTYTFTPVNSIVKVSEIDRAATGTTAAASEYFGYDGNGYLASKIDWNGNATTYANDSHGDPTSIKEGVSAGFGLVYPFSGWSFGSTGLRNTSITYDSTWVHEPASITTQGATPVAGVYLLIAGTGTTSFTYDGSGNPLTRTDTDTSTNTVPYSTNGQTRETQWTWNGTGELTSVQSPRTDVTVKTTLGYTSGVLTSITDQLSHTTSITSYTGGGYPETIVDPNSVTTTLAYDGRLNLNTVTVGGTYTTTYTHDPANNLTAIEKPDGSTLTYGYDAANRLTMITDLPGNTISYTLDALGDITATNVKNSGGAYALYNSATFDALGRILTFVGASSQTTTYTWDPNSNPLTVTDPLSNTTTYTWDALNRLATRTDPSPGGTTTLTLDAHNRPTNVQDANGNSTSYVNDGFGDVTQVTSPDSGTSVYHYDKDRNLTQKVFAGGQTVNLTWDADDRNLTIAYPSDSSLNVSKTYDQSGHGYGIGRLTSVTDQPGSDSFTYDTRGNITGESRVITSVGTLSTSTSFDAASHVSSITYPSGTVVGYTRDSMGQVTGIAATPPGGSSTSVASSITYEPFGPETSLTFGNGVTGTYNFDGDYRATSREDNATAGDVTNFAYAYTATNSLYTITDSVNSVNSQTLGYDALDRLTSATSAAGGYGTYGWTWDAVSNIQTQTINSTTTTFSQNAGTNQLSQSVTGATTTTVDTTANGNILDFKIAGTAITSYTYNQANQMASATGPLSNSASYKYGFDGQRLEKTPSSGYPIVYQYGQAAKEILSENDLHSGQTADYIYMDPGRNSRPIGEVNPTSGDVYFTHTDRQGTPQAITDSGQNVVWSAFYNPFGDTSSFSGTLTNQSLRLPGQYFDPESGNNHNGFRDYAGTLTRYVQSDPIGLRAGTNTYQYAFGNPFRFTDRSGLDSNSSGGGGNTITCDSPTNPACSGGGIPPITIGGNCDPNDPNCIGGSGLPGSAPEGPFSKILRGSGPAAGAAAALCSAFSMGTCAFAAGGLALASAADTIAQSSTDAGVGELWGQTVVQPIFNDAGPEGAFMGLVLGWGWDTYLDGYYSSPQSPPPSTNSPSPFKPEP